MSESTESTPAQSQCGCCCGSAAAKSTQTPDLTAVNKAAKAADTDAYPGTQGVQPNPGYNPTQHGGINGYSPIGHEGMEGEDSSYPSVQGAAKPSAQSYNPTQQGSHPVEPEEQ